MGYQIGVTPLQMAAAVSSVANGGQLVEPRVVRAVIRNSRRVPVPRKVLGRTISEGTARQLTTIMEAVVTDGTGTRAAVHGHTVAGKTGTASKVVNGAYSRSDYNVSFVGFVPSRAPVFTIVVVVDSPHKQTAYGGVVAAPIFQRIAEAALRHQGVPSTLNPVPPVLVARRDESAPRPISGPAAPAITVSTGVADGDDVFPDLLGMSARDAVRLLAQRGIGARLQGAGVVVSQDPAPGTPLTSGVVRLQLERRARSAVETGVEPPVLPTTGP
jgi:membrane peptidoglycan carboxypeptidase